jgi:hypothetical protein
MRNLAGVVVVVAALGCGSGLVGQATGGSGGHGGFAGAGGSAGAGASGGAGGSAGAGGGGAGGGGTGGGGAGAGGQSTVPSCLQDLFAACGFSYGQCNVDVSDGGAYSVCFESGASYTHAGDPPCGGPDAGTVEQTTTFRRPDGSACYVQRAEYGTPFFMGGWFWDSVSYTWTDATGSTVATGQVIYPQFEILGRVSITCAGGGATTSCTQLPDLPPSNPCPTFTPTCNGTSGPCRSPPDAASP